MTEAPSTRTDCDALRDAYLEYVIDYDLGDQLEVLEQLGVERRGRGVEIDWKLLGPWLIGAAGLGFVIVLGRRAWKQL